MNWPRRKRLAIGAIILVALIFAIQGLRKNPFRAGRIAQDPPFKFDHAVLTSSNTVGGISPADDPTGLVDFKSNIPVLVLRADPPGPVSKGKKFSSFRLEIYQPTNGTPASLTNAPAVTARVALHARGMLSRAFPKLSYRVKVEDDGAGGTKLPLLGMPSHEDWVLHSSWLDKSLIRNAFSYDLATAMGCAAMRSRPCEVFVSTSGQPVTEADYQGVYQLIEHVERASNRIDVKKLAPEQNSEEEITGGYIVAWDVGPGNYLPSWTPRRDRSLQLLYPKKPSEAQIQYIDQAFQAFDRALRGPDFQSPEHGYAAHIDVDAWVNYILFEEFIFNLDAYVRSFYFHKDRGGKIRPGPVWDHDLALGHQFQEGTPFNVWWYIPRAPAHGWISRLASDPAFATRFARRWLELRQDVLTDANIAARVDRIAAPLLSGAADRNFQRWKVLDVERPFPKPNDYITIGTRTYPEQIEALKRFLLQRARWMDADLREPTQPSKAR